MSVTIKQFTGKDGKTYDILVLKNGEDDRYVLSFGVTKAKLILGHMKEIKKFVDDTESVLSV